MLDTDRIRSPAEPDSREPVRDAPGGTTTLYVCITCQEADSTNKPIVDGSHPGPDEPRAGARLLEALAASRPDGCRVAIVGVACLSNCRRACTVALASEGRWTYVYGDLDPVSSVGDILDGAALYAASVDGIVPWRERPSIFRKGVVARIPPLRPLG